MRIKVKKLKSILKEALETLNDYNDNDEVKTRSNSYGLSGNILDTRDGFLQLDEINVADDRELDDEK